MKRKHRNNHSGGGVSRKKRRCIDNDKPMICVICLSEMESHLLHDHYAKYHAELLTSASSNFKYVANKYNNSPVKDGSNGHKEEYRKKLEKLHKKSMSETKKKKKSKIFAKEEPIKFNVPRFELKTNINNFNHIQNVNIINNDNNNNNNHQSMIKKKKKSKKRKKRKRNRQTTTTNADNNNNKKITDELANVFYETMHQTTTLSKRGQIFHQNKNVIDPKDKFEAIVHSLMKFESNQHPLSHLLSNPSIIPSDLSQCKLLIKILFEQLFNARQVCDEQQQFIEYMNQIDVGNRMQILFILRYLKEGHLPIYMKCYEQLQANPQWQNWKNVRMNDAKIKELRQNIQRIKDNERALDKKAKNEDCAQNVQKNQMRTIYNLKNEQTAAIQRYGLKLNEQMNSNQNINDQSKKLFGSKIDLSQALKSVDSINLSSMRHNSEYVDLIKDAKDSDNEDNDDDDEDGDEWADAIKQFLSDVNCKIPRLDLSQIVERLNSLRYCSEFDVLNDVLNDIDNDKDIKEVKLRFVEHFGNLSQWNFNRLIKWCQCNNLYQCCAKIRQKKVSGKQFINLFGNMSDCRQFFSNLTTPQTVSLFHKINGYFDDSLSVL